MAPNESKMARAEPISSETERGNVKFVGAFPQLEDQMTSLTAERYLGPGSPDRVDAFVSIATELSFGSLTSTDPDDYEVYQK